DSSDPSLPIIGHRLWLYLSQVLKLEIRADACATTAATSSSTSTTTFWRAPSTTTFWRAPSTTTSTGFHNVIDIRNLETRTELASSEIPKLRKEDQKARNALLADIQQGTRLRKVTQINDRSAPQIEKPKGANRDGGNPAVNKGGSQQPLGGLFAGGFPVLRPAGQRDMTGRPGQLSGARAASPRPSAPPSSGAAKASSSPPQPAEGPRAAVPPEPPGPSRAAAAAGPGRPSLPAPPPPPPASSKPSLTFPPPPPLPPPADRPAKGVSPGAAPPLPPPQADKPAKLQPGPSHPLPPPPPPPPLPPVPPCGLPGRAEPSAAAAAPAEGRDCALPTPPPPPPPPPPHAAPNRLSFPPSPAFSGADLPPPLPPKSPHLLPQLHKPSNIQSLPLPPTPGPPQPAAVEPVLGSWSHLHSHQQDPQQLNLQASLESQPGLQLMTPTHHLKMEICTSLMTLNQNLLSILWKISPHLMNSNHFRKHIPARYPEIPQLLPDHSPGEIGPIHVPCTIHAYDQVSPGIERRHDRVLRSSRVRVPAHLLTLAAAQCALTARPFKLAT
ncbi:WAS/WASL-interacting protein family member 3, partial [Lamprotornis superbus]